MKALISFVLLCAVLVGGYMTFIKKDTTYDASQNAPAVENANEVKGVEETVAPTEPFTIKGTFFDLAKKSGSYKCTVSHEVSVAESVGTVYVSGSKIRGEFTSTIPQVKMKVNSTMISDGTSLYTWTDMAKTGFKAKIVEPTAPASSDSAGNEYMQNLNYSCSPWTPDESLFVVPADITFIDTNK